MKKGDIWVPPVTRPPAIAPKRSVRSSGGTPVPTGSEEEEVFVAPPVIVEKVRETWWWLHGFTGCYQDRPVTHPRCRYGCAGMPSPEIAGVSMHFALCPYWQSPESARVSGGEDIPF